MKPLLWLLILAGILVLLLGLLYLQPVDMPGPNGQGLKTQTPVVSEQVVPGKSQDVRTLPTAEPHKPGEPIPEVNPRQRGTAN